MPETGGAKQRIAATGIVDAPFRPEARVVETVAGEKEDRLDFLAGDSAMGGLIRSVDWTSTPIGSIETWSPTLRVMVGFMLPNRFPLLLWWGPQYVSIYNDAYRPILGTKHPKAMGQPVSECWSEIWNILQPLIDAPFQGGPATWMDDILLEINRHGFVEETHFTIAYSPVPDETAPRGIGGVLATVHEISEKIFAERRAVILRDLGAGISKAKSAEEACAIAAITLAKHPRDVPFALFYLVDTDGKKARLVGNAGVNAEEIVCPAEVEIESGDAARWPLSQALRAETMQVVEEIASRFTTVPAGPWTDPPRTAVVLPIPSNRSDQPAGFLVAGISSRLKLDDLYRGFLGLVVTQIATAIGNARAYEEERKRAEALAAIDRAKTLFFSNVSHEFRTPLTLMLGPLEDVLSSPDLPDQEREGLSVAHRNSLRLLRLVNTLLDFSRVEAGRIQASYEPVDLPALTRDVASNFRSACDKAELNLIIDCPPLSEPIYVDPEMWEKIVLNLVSNAFKFTLKGGIVVQLRSKEGAAELIVRDTGVGIPPDELLLVFERFHRVEGERGRAHEGTGIGLALVKELVELHGGKVKAESALGEGTVFTVSIPFGKTHLAADRIGVARTLASTATRASAFVEEALRWLPPSESDEPTNERTLHLGDAEDPTLGKLVAQPSRVLLADDNADMRDYIVRLLTKAGLSVGAVPDGHAALAAARREPPDLILSDVMMPKLDGLGLLKELRVDPQFNNVPVILVSARAGEEARLEGLEAGADDYLTKPFSARELVARIVSNLQLARVRKEAEEASRESDERLRHANAELAQRVVELQAAADHRLLLINELNHRVKNTLATVQAIAAQTFRGAGIDRTVRDAFEARLIALANAHNILTQKNWEGAEMHEIVGRALEPHADPERFHVEGPTLLLSPKTALAISMGLHELATNAVKYGALSVETGNVAVRWQIDGPEPGTLHLQWKESKGPMVSPPNRKGFGSRLIERNLAHDLHGQATIEYRPNGVICSIVSPLEPQGGRRA